MLELSRPSIGLKTPLPSPSASPQPSPILFPESPAFLHQSSPFASAQAERPPSPAAGQQLAIAALDTLLCALVDRPKNMRAFEELGGLTSIVKVLKDRHVAQPVRFVEVFLTMLPRALSEDDYFRQQNQDHRASVLLPPARDKLRYRDVDHIFESFVELFRLFLCSLCRNVVYTLFRRFHAIYATQHARKGSGRLYPSNPDKTKTDFDSSAISFCDFTT